jgi:membrane protein
MAGLKDRVTGTLRRQRARRPWLDHLIRAYKQYKDANGDHVAAAITYFSFLALFPLLLLGASIAGFVLANNDDLQGRLQKVISENVPGSLGSTMSDALQ